MYRNIFFSHKTITAFIVNDIPNEINTNLKYSQTSIRKSPPYWRRFHNNRKCGNIQLKIFFSLFDQMHKIDCFT